MEVLIRKLDILFHSIKNSTTDTYIKKEKVVQNFTKTGSILTYFKTEAMFLLIYLCRSYAA